MAFSNANSFSVENANFINANNFFSHSYTPLARDPAETILDQARAVEATHTSSTASYATKCSPETRREIIANIADWVVGGEGAKEHAAPPMSILWFTGPAGGGKTCIMRDVVDRCAAAGLSAVSYFFSTRDSGLNNGRAFVATIVHQLAALDPILKPIIYDAIRDRPSIFKESLDFQLDKLVVETLESEAFRSQRPSPRKIVIAVDGFDECSQELEREHLLNLLRSLVHKLPQLVTVIIASRPEFDLRRAFKYPDLKNITYFVQLQEYDGTKDIRVFLCDEFAMIRATHYLGHLISENWPLEEIILILLEKSSGNFIYPATVIKYIKGSRRSPVDSLDIILGTSSSDVSNPLAELDALYFLVLHPPDTDLALMKRIIHCIIGLDKPPSASFLDAFLGLPPNTTTTTLCDLHSILSVPDSEDGTIKILHKSLEDYLLDPKRSLDFFQSPYETQVDLATVCVQNVRRWATKPVVDRSSYLEYSCFRWDHHLTLCVDNKPSSETLPNILVDMDPVVGLKYHFTHSRALEFYRGLQVPVHASLCSKLRCVPLCQRVAHIRERWVHIQRFHHSFPKLTAMRLEAISRFISETGANMPLGLGNEGEEDAATDGSTINEPPQLRLTTVSPQDDSDGPPIPVRDSLDHPSRPPSQRQSVGGEASSSTLSPPSLLPPPTPEKPLPPLPLSYPPPPSPPPSNPDRETLQVNSLARRTKRWFGKSRSPSRS